MKTSLSLTAKIYLVILGVAAVGLLVYLFFITGWADLNWLTILLFLFLTFLSDSYPVRLPNGVIISVSFAVIFGAILIFQPIVVVIISVLGDLLSLRKGRSLVQYLFNAAQLTLSTGIAALAFHSVNPGQLNFSLHYLTAALVPLLLCFLLNSFFITFIIALTRQERPSSVWLTNIKWAAPSYISMAPLGLIIALIYQNIGIWGLVLFCIPMLIARQSFISYMNMRQTFLDTIQSLSATIDAKDPYTKGHSFRVAAYSTALARELGWSEEKVELLQYVALIHDLGKVAIPETILKKEGKLTGAEFAQMREHSLIGFNIIKDIKFLAGGADIIKHHHERWDGKGYPDGLKGELIPEGARILAVADAFDAMTSDRSYRKALGTITAMQEIKEGAGTQFDPQMAATFIRIIPRLNLDGKTESAGGVISGQPVVAETEH
jgi:putative nucleotidyltransferase with HDIG domain